MKVCIAVLLLALGCGLLGQEDDSQCGPVPENGVHECHCSNMVEAVQRTYQEDCKKLSTQKERDACLNSRPQTCDVMDYPPRYQYRDSSGTHEAADHPDQCLRKCKPTQCTCNEGACQRPTVRPKKGRKR